MQLIALIIAKMAQKVNTAKMKKCNLHKKPAEAGFLEYQFATASSRAMIVFIRLSFKCGT